MASMAVKIKFSAFIENYKAERHFNTIIETICYVIDKKLFPMIDYDNVKKYITDSLKDKLLLESSRYNYIKSEHSKYISDVWNDIF